MPSDAEPSQPSLTRWLYHQARSLWITGEPKAPTAMPGPGTNPEMHDSTPRPQADPRPPCHLLNLPAELRATIYEYCLAPGVLVLSSTSTKRYVAMPTPAPALLCTCRQIYKETNELLYTNNEIVFAVDAHDTCWPAIDERRTPQHVLQRLEHICVILDCTANFRADYTDVDFAPFEALTSLKTLRLGVIYDSSLPVIQVVSLSRGDELFEQILMRVPKATSVLSTFECGSMQQVFLESQFEKRKGTSKNPKSIRVMPDSEVKDLVACVEERVKGSMSGGDDDKFAEYHDESRAPWRRFDLGS